MLSALLLAAAPALARDYIIYWPPESLPRTWYMDDDPEDSMPAEYREEVLLKSYENWHVATCAAISEEYGGEDDYGIPDSNDGVTVNYWDDPSDYNDPGALGVTYCAWGADEEVVAGANVPVARDADIVFSKDVDWATTEDISQGSCANEYAVEGVATHEIGHSWGLPHTCEEGDICSDPDLRDATMYWSVGPCDLTQNDLNSDDIEAITGLYGPYATFSATTERFGGAPMEVCFEVASEDEVTGATWNFGDGEQSVEINPCHTYTRSGQFTVTVTIALASPTCGEATYTYSELGYVLSCEAPKPEEGATGFFELLHSDGLTYQTVNHSDLSVYGCIDTISWAVYPGTSSADIVESEKIDFNGDGEGDDIGAWSPKITFPAEGSYVVVMNVGGPGGLVADYLVVEAEDRRAEGSGGCSTAPGAVGSLAGLALAGAALVRRRR